MANKWLTTRFAKSQGTAGDNLPPALMFMITFLSLCESSTDSRFAACEIFFAAREIFRGVSHFFFLLCNLKSQALISYCFSCMIKCCYIVFFLSYHWSIHLVYVCVCECPVCDTWGQLEVWESLPLACGSWVQAQVARLGRKALYRHSLLGDSILDFRFLEF